MISTIDSHKKIPANVTTNANVKQNSCKTAVILAVAVAISNWFSSSEVFSIRVTNYTFIVIAIPENVARIIT